MLPKKSSNISNTTPSSGTAKTAWARRLTAGLSPHARRWGGLMAAGVGRVAIIIFVILGLLAGYHAFVHKHNAPVACSTDAYRMDMENVALTGAAGNTFNLERADTPAAQGQGLSGRECIPQHYGMLFTFADAGTQCFWMKDMHFAIDIVWLDSDKIVRHIEPGLAPSTYPKNYCPEVAARYVLELHEGLAAGEHITEGSQLHF